MQVYNPSLEAVGLPFLLRLFLHFSFAGLVFGVSRRSYGDSSHHDKEFIFFASVGATPTTALRYMQQHFLHV